MPSGADVFLNNAHRGPTPITLHSLEPGSYTLLVRLSGYRDWQSDVRVSAGETVEIKATLIQKPPSDRPQSGIPAYLTLGSLTIAALLWFSRK